MEERAGGGRALRASRGLGRRRVEERARGLHRGWRKGAERSDVMAESGHARGDEA